MEIHCTLQWGDYWTFTGNFRNFELRDISFETCNKKNLETIPVLAEDFLPKKQQQQQQQKQFPRHKQPCFSILSTAEVQPSALYVVMETFLYALEPRSGAEEGRTQCNEPEQLEPGKIGQAEIELTRILTRRVPSTPYKWAHLYSILTMRFPILNFIIWNVIFIITFEIIFLAVPFARNLFPQIFKRFVPLPPFGEGAPCPFI